MAGLTMMDSVGTGTCFGMRIKREHRDGMDAWNEGLKRRIHEPFSHAVDRAGRGLYPEHPELQRFSHGAGLLRGRAGRRAEHNRGILSARSRRVSAAGECDGRTGHGVSAVVREESEWVSGARALGEFYQQKARERERLADQYQTPSGDHVQPPAPAHEHRGSPQ